MKKPLLLGIIIIAGLAGLVWLARPGGAKLPESVAGVAALTASESKFAFGTISMADGDVSRQVTIKNTGTAPVEIGRVYSSCMCTTVAVSINDRKYGPFGMQGHGFIPPVKDTIAPGGEAVLTVTFDPAAHGPAGIGHIERAITVENDSGTPTTVLFSVDVTP